MIKNNNKISKKQILKLRILMNLRKKLNLTLFKNKFKKMTMKLKIQRKN